MSDFDHFMETLDETLDTKEAHEIEMAMLHMDQERYCDLTEQVEKLLAKTKDLEARNRELERMLETMKQKYHAANLENTRLFHRLDELQGKFYE